MSKFGAESESEEIALEQREQSVVSEDTDRSHAILMHKSDKSGESTYPPLITPFWIAAMEKQKHTIIDTFVI